MKGTLSISWGKYGGFYLHRHANGIRLCLGLFSIDYLRMEIDELLTAAATADGDASHTTEQVPALLMPEYLTNAYTDWISAGMNIKQLDEAYEVTLPIADRHNDHIQIYVERSGELMRLSDDGYTLSDLRASGLDIDAPELNARIQAALPWLDIIIDNGELTIDAVPAHLIGMKMHSLAQAMLAVSNLWLLAQADDLKGELKAAGQGDGGSPARRQPSDLISKATVRNALQVIGRRLGVDSMSAIQYEAERQALLGEAADKEEAYALDEALPSAQRLQTKYDNWAAVCKEAGLEPPEGPSGARVKQRVNPGSYDLPQATKAMLDALAWAAMQGRELTQRAYQEYAASHEGVPSLNALQKLLKRESLGSFAQFRIQVTAERLKQPI